MRAKILKLLAESKSTVHPTDPELEGTILYMAELLLRADGFYAKDPPGYKHIRQILTFLCWFPAPWKTPEFRRSLRGLISGFVDFKGQPSQQAYLFAAIAQDPVLRIGFSRAHGRRGRGYEPKTRALRRRKRSKKLAAPPPKAVKRARHA